MHEIDFIRYEPDLAHDAPWVAYIPPTLPQHYEGGDMNNGSIIGPWGESHWFTFQQAADFLCKHSFEVEQSVRVLQARNRPNPVIGDVT